MDSKELLRLLDLLEKESAARAADNVAFQQALAGQNAIIVHLNETIGKLLEEIRLLKTPKKNSRNSSVPPSKDENRPKKTNSLRTPSDKRPGGQNGHEGNTLKMSCTPDRVVEHKAQYCNCCGAGLEGAPTELAGRRQVVDIPPVKPVYTEHRVYRTACTCGHQTTVQFPTGVNAPISYGPQTEATIAYMHARQYIPFARISELFASVYNMPISTGAVCAILERFAIKSAPAYQLIKEAVAGAKVVGADETGMKNNGKLGWFWTWQSLLATYIAYSPNRGSDTVKDHFPNGFPDAVLVHDCWKSHLATPALAHQLCIAHLLRELIFFEEKHTSTWASDFKKMLYAALDLKKSILPENYGKPLKERAELESRLVQLLEEKIPQGHTEVIVFQKRIIKYKNNLLTFLYHQEVPPDNNASERAIRNIKVKQKVSGLFKSEKGAQIYASIRSITDTCIKNAQSVMEAFCTIAKLKPE